MVQSVCMTSWQGWWWFSIIPPFISFIKIRRYFFWNGFSDFVFFLVATPSFFVVRRCGTLSLETINWKKLINWPKQIGQAKHHIKANMTIRSYKLHFFRVIPPRSICQHRSTIISSHLCLWLSPRLRRWNNRTPRMRDFTPSRGMRWWRWGWALNQ